jgi:hypothetical protein
VVLWGHEFTRGSPTFPETGPTQESAEIVLVFVFVVVVVLVFVLLRLFQRREAGSRFSFSFRSVWGEEKAFSPVGDGSFQG